jgi:hypothetical protein
LPTPDALNCKNLIAESFLPTEVREASSEEAHMRTTIALLTIIFLSFMVAMPIGRGEPGSAAPAVPISTGSAAQVTQQPTASDVGGVALQVPAEQRRPLPGLPVMIDSTFRVGDFIARGNPVDANRDGLIEPTECDLNFGIGTKLFSGTRSIDLRVLPGCIVVVNEITDTAVIEQAPRAAVPRRGLLALVNRVWEFFVPTVYAIGPKRVTNYVWQYGYGGWWDDLTEVRGFNDWSWDGTNAWNNYVYGYCSAESYETGWRHTGCWIRRDINYSSDRVDRIDEGNFYWVCPGGQCYIHQLYNQRQGTKFGEGLCYGWYAGSIVYGLHQICQVAGPPPPCGAGNICFEDW